MWLDILWILVCFGITNGIVISKMTKPFREWTSKKTTLFQCPLCLGFWVGLFLNLTWHSPTNFFLWDMFLGSATSWLIYLLVMERQNKT